MSSVDFVYLSAPIGDGPPGDLLLSTQPKLAGESMLCGPFSEPLTQGTSVPPNTTFTDRANGCS